MTASTFPFERELPPATAEEIARLEADGYKVHKEWANGIELRKGKPFRDWLLAVHVLALVCFPMLLVPGIMRSAVNNLFGYKYRVLVTLDPQGPEIFSV